MKIRLVLTTLWAVAFLCVNAASAAIITYTDRTTWDTAVGGADFTVDFESFLVDTSFAGADLDVGPFRLHTAGTAEPGRNFVDVAPFLFPPVPASFGNAAVDIFVEEPLAADIFFDTPVIGFFADFLYAGNTQELTLTLVDGGFININVPGPGDSLQPFGFLSTADPILALRMRNTVNDGFYLDNVSGAVVPEPSAVLLFGIGAIVVGQVIRRRSA